ncbi:hypothetical protein FRC09_013461 [Ceratobasidium sp. 395]|nr:hypothetical protein FRC09_013461 [Ceratobasidium sp. 395]
MTAAARSNAENAPLKLDSPTSINSDGFASPRKLSDASHFSLSMFPPTPTTPNYGDIVRAGLNSANSPLRQTFSPTRESLSAPPVGFAPPFSPRSLQPPSPPHHHRSAPNTPVRRSTAEADHGSFLSYTQNRTKRASTDSPTQHQKKAQSIANHHLPAISPKPDQPSPRVAQPFPDRERTNTLASLGSDSVYSQDQDSDSGSCYSDDDDAASMTSSVAEAIMMAQEERRFSRQSRLAYMRDVAMSESAQEPSVESHASLSSDPDSSEQSASPVTPDDDEIGGYPEEKAAIPLVRLERPSEAPPTVNIIPPNRKAAPRMSTVSGSTLGNLPRITPEPELKPLRPSPSMFSIRSRSTPMSRVPGKIVISHPHMNAENALGAEVLPQGADIGASRVTLTTDGGVGVHSLAHSRSMPALRVPGSSTLNVREKKQKEPKPLFDKYGTPSVEQLSLASEMSVYDEYGRPVRFGDIFESQKTAVCFIRHF